jgi:hypothetical protein
MRRLIQVYDEECIRNIGALMCMGFTESIFLYDKYTDTKNIDLLKKVMKKYSEDKLIFYEIIDRNIDLSNLVNKNTYFNLNGPDNLLNVLVSMYVEKNSFNSFYLFTNNQKLISLNNSEVLLSCVNKIKLNIEDIININGSIIIGHNDSQPNINDKDLIKDIISISEIMKKDFNHWNRYISKLSTLITIYHKGAYIPLNKKTKVILNDYVTKGLIRNKIIKVEGNKIIFKSNQCKKMLKSSGSWLEYLTYIRLQQSNYFDDVRMNLVIDFDGDLNRTIDDRCEIDVVCLKGLKPVFISNKAGHFNQDTLYEIVSHARMFGNKNGIPVLCTSKKISEINSGLYKKAQELGIYIIDYDDINNNKIAIIVKDIVNDKYNYK